eukprot:2198387-Rhodomonas_salina.1
MAELACFKFCRCHAGLVRSLSDPSLAGTSRGRKNSDHDEVLYYFSTTKTSLPPPVTWQITQKT